MSLDDSEPKEQQAKEAQKEPDDDSNSEEEAAGGEWQQPTSCATLKAASHDNNSQLEATVGLLRHCRELDGFLATWREAYAELRGAVLELQTLTTSQSELTTSRFERRGQLTKANLAGRGRTDVAKDAEVELEFTSLAINNNSKTHLSTALGDVLGEAIGDVLGEADDKLGNIVNGRPSLINGKDRHGGHHSPHGSDDDSSSSFDLEVEEEWSKRISDMEARLREKEQYEDYDDDDDDDDDDDPVLYLPFLHSRPMAQILDRIEEVANEDVERTSDASCGNSAADTSDEDDSSRESSVSVERLWASVRQVAPTVPIGKTGDAPYFSPGGPHSLPGPKLPASFRTRGPMGPKEEGPLSKLMDAELLESDDD
mmetsp:Transcript_133482/g.259898  ORF Transcript_133482/g.259898 Transcript_133482/m.259898 type:complete len:370 (-) Transcript_133482:139-1248(-)